MPLPGRRVLIGRPRALRASSDPPSIDWPRTLAPAGELRTHLGTRASKRSATACLPAPKMFSPRTAPAAGQNMARWRRTLLDNIVSWTQILGLEAGAGPWLGNSSLEGF